MNARELLITAEILFAVPLVGRLLAAAPALGPPRAAPVCAVPVERAGEGVHCAGEDAVAGSRAGPGPGRMAPARLAALGVAVDLNRASAAELASLDGIGPRLAARIVAARPFARVDELGRVRGIGAQRLERLRPRLRVTSVSDGSRDLARPLRLDAPEGDGV